jgi:hypothetical protein
LLLARASRRAGWLQPDIGRAARALASNFERLAPTGDLISGDQLLEKLAAGSGAYPPLTITIEHLGTRSGRGTSYQSNISSNMLKTARSTGGIAARY